MLGTDRPSPTPRARVGIALALSLAGLQLISPDAVRGEALSLSDALARARRDAREIAAAASDVLASEARIDRAEAHRLPLVSLSESWYRTDSPAEVFALALSQERFSFQDFVASDPNQPDALTALTTRLELSAPLYTGGELSARILQAHLAAGAARGRAERSADQAALAAGEAFLQLDQARAYAALLERSLDTATEHAELARAYVEQGLLVSSELLRAEVEVARVEDLLVAARGRAKVAEAMLSLRLGAALGSSWSLVPPGQPAELEPALEPWVAGAAERSDLQAARQMARAAALEVDVAKAARRPRVGISMRYDLVDDQLFGTRGDHASIAAGASIDLFAGGRHRAAAASAEATADGAAIQADLFREGIELEIRAAWQEAASARDRLATAGRAVAAAEETERIVEERFRQGVVKVLDLLDASVARREAETRELVARTDAHLANLRLVTAAGQRPESALPTPPEGTR